MSNGRRLFYPPNFRLLGTALARRFDTKASRFRLAVTSGFLLVSAGALVLGVNAHSGSADSIWGAMSMGGGSPTVSGGGYADQGARGTGYRRATVSDDRRPLYERKRAFRSRGGAKVQLASASDSENATLAMGHRSICVRLCDGFAFPVGTYHGGDLASHEATCRSECPGAETALYIVPPGSDSMNDATQARSGENYSELPAAFHYTTVLSDACTCHPPAGNRIKSLLHDFTLRRGDAVMTTAGIRVFHGAARYPYKRTDFIALSKSRDVPKQKFGAIRAIEQASLKVPNVATPQGAAPSPTVDRGMKALQHQASLETAR